MPMNEVTRTFCIERPIQVTFFCYIMNSKAPNLHRIDSNRRKGIAHCQHQVLSTQLKRQDKKHHCWKNNKEASRHEFIQIQQQNHLEIVSANRKRLEPTCKCALLTFIMQMNDLTLSQLQLCVISCHFTSDQTTQLSAFGGIMLLRSC